MITKQQLKMVKRAQGATLRWNNGELKVLDLKEGYMVSLENYEFKFKKLKRDKIGDMYLQQLFAIIEYPQFDEHFIGIWKHEGMWYLDISIKVETKTKALALAKKHNQSAIFDNKNKQTIEL